MMDDPSVREYGRYMYAIFYSVFSRYHLKLICHQDFQMHSKSEDDLKYLYIL